MPRYWRTKAKPTSAAQVQGGGTPVVTDFVVPRFRATFYEAFRDRCGAATTVAKRQGLSVRFSDSIQTTP